MTRFVLASILYLTLGLCYSTIIDDREKTEEDQFNSNHFEHFREQDGDDEFLVYPGSRPLRGRKEVLNIFKKQKEKGLHHYIVSPIQEFDMGTHLLLLGSYKAYSETETLIDDGEYVKFYVRKNGELIVNYELVSSNLTPWPASTPYIKLLITADGLQ